MSLYTVYITVHSYILQFHEVTGVIMRQKSEVLDFISVPLATYTLPFKVFKVQFQASGLITDMTVIPFTCSSHSKKHSVITFDLRGHYIRCQTRIH